jgi:hypothetical protein
MVIEGAARGRPAALAAHLLRTDHNEQVNILDIWGTGAPDLESALLEMHAIGAGARSKRTLYHANIDPRKDEPLSPLQKRRAVAQLAKGLGFEDQPFAVVEHVKNGRQHLHVVWSRIDLETMTAIPDSHNYRKHEEVARDLEREFGHREIPRVHIRDKANEPRPGPAPKFAEYQQTARSGMTPQEAKKIVTECWRVTATGFDFRHRLEAEGFTLARGDRRDFILVDRGGEIHGLTRRVESVKAAEVRERMKDLDLDQLPDVMAARAQLRQRQKAQELEAAKEFTSAAERLRAEELLREAEAKGHHRPGLSNADREIADALWQLDKTMRGQMNGVIAGKPSAEQRQQHRAEMGARPEMDAGHVRYESRREDLADKKPVRDPAREKPQTLETPDGSPQRDQVRSAPGAIPPVMTPAAPERRPQPSVWQRVAGWVRGRSRDKQQARVRYSGASRVARPFPEASQRPSVSAEKSRTPGNSRTEPEYRPAADPVPRDQAKRPQALNHDAGPRHAVEPPVQDAAVRAQTQQQKPGPGPSKAPRVKRESHADEAMREYNNRPESVKEAERARAAADRLREDEDRGRERVFPGSDDPRYS